MMKNNQFNSFWHGGYNLLECLFREFPPSKLKYIFDRIKIRGLGWPIFHFDRMSLFESTTSLYYSIKYSWLSGSSQLRKGRICATQQKLRRWFGWVAEPICPKQMGVVSQISKMQLFFTNFFGAMHLGHLVLFYHTLNSLKPNGLVYFRFNLIKSCEKEIHGFLNPLNSRHCNAKNLKMIFKFDLQPPFAYCKLVPQPTQTGAAKSSGSGIQRGWVSLQPHSFNDHNHVCGWDTSSWLSCCKLESLASLGKCPAFLGLKPEIVCWRRRMVRTLLVFRFPKNMKSCCSVSAIFMLPLSLFLAPGHSHQSILLLQLSQELTTLFSQISISDNHPMPSINFANPCSDIMLCAKFYSKVKIKLLPPPTNIPSLQNLFSILRFLISELKIQVVVLWKKKIILYGVDSFKLRKRKKERRRVEISTQQNINACDFQQLAIPNLYHIDSLHFLIGSLFFCFLHCFHFSAWITQLKHLVCISWLPRVSIFQQNIFSHGKHQIWEPSSPCSSPCLQQ
ncbi:hypothetical protein VP01_3315g1 [Puccinia sorghi]|uniref:Uncharacterized protein n=1 Tax=Puccinia sorghi TaxID=27349 RepID=A0A0L6UY61_9BASI|nr:hypothetical protein VP01_3315g1 [Puccinia sorghi]